MKIKNITVTFAGAAMLLANTICASAAVPEGAFDAAYYASTYADLGAAFGNDEEALYSHYLQNGILEGRFGSPDFDVRTYREKYPDLDAVFGDDWDAYFWHYLTLGISEGRTAVAAEASDQAKQESDGTQPNDTQAGNNSPAGDGTQPESGSSSDGSTQPGNSSPAVDGTQPEGIPAEQESYFDNTLALDAFNAINQYRIENGKTALNWSAAIYGAATVRAEEIASLFSHTRPNGESCFTALNDQKISYRSAGENIAAGQPTGQSVATAWYNSEGHRNNMLSDKYGNAAIACYVQDGRCYWVNLFTN